MRRKRLNLGERRTQLNDIASTALAVTMIAAFLLAAGAIALVRRGERRKAVLMMVAAAVLVGNVLIWTI